MIERVHEHIIAELQQNTRSDTVFIIVAILLNLVALGVNSAVAGGSNRDGTSWVVFFTFVCLVIVINFVVEIGLIKGKQSRIKLISGLLKMQNNDNLTEAEQRELSDEIYRILIITKVTSSS